MSAFSLGIYYGDLLDHPIDIKITPAIK